MIEKMPLLLWVRFFLRFLARGLPQNTLRPFIAQIKFKKSVNTLVKDSKSTYTVYTISKIHNPLTDLADHYGSDKGSNKESNHRYLWAPHTYTDFYNKLFADKKNEIRRIFECGIGTNKVGAPSSMGANGIPGASLRMWRDYFPNALVYGGDVDSDIIFVEPRIQTFYLNQLDPNSIAKFWTSVNATNFDIMIDDGLHTFDAGITLYKNSIHHLAINGIYIIEDVSPIDLEKYQNELQKSNLAIDFVIIDNKRSKVQNDNLIVIRKF